MCDVADDRVVARILCADCGGQASFAELVPPGLRPHDFPTWSEQERGIYERQYSGNDKWHFISRGIDAAMGSATTSR